MWLDDVEVVPLKLEGLTDYGHRFQLVQDWKLVTKPDFPNKVAFDVTDGRGLEELSFAFFVGWLFLTVLSDGRQAAKVAFVGHPNGSSILVISRRSTQLAAPGRRLAYELLDEKYWECPLDADPTAELAKDVRLFCPVVNRIRFNIGHAGVGLAGLEAPRATKDCCGGKKDPLWKYLGETLLKEPERYGAMVGGTAIPIAIPFDRLLSYLKGFEPLPDTLGQLLEETLLWVATAAAGTSLGLPHAKFVEPFESNEIDFLVYDHQGHHKTAKNGAWNAHVGKQRVCLYEMTVGHFGEDQTTDRTASRGAGNDHPHKKLVNFNAVGAIGFKEVQYQYISLLGQVGTTLSPALQFAMKNVPSFNYWCLKDECPDVHDAVLNHFEKPVPIASLRDWHARVVKRVRDSATAFGKSA